MYAGDLADCILNCIDKFDTLPFLMNVGTGEDFSINEFYNQAASVLGYKGRFEHDLSKPVGMSRKIVCIEKQIKWGWNPITPLATGIEKTYRYYLQHS